MIGILTFFGVLLLLIMTGFTWRIYTYFLKLERKIKITTGILAILVPVFFIITMILIRSSTFEMPISAYLVMQYLAGFGYYLFLGALVLGIIGVFFALIKRSLPIWIARILLIVPVVFTILGFIQATHIRTTYYNISHTDLGFPDSWQGKKIALVADTHFGINLKKSFSDKVIAHILAENPDIVLHAGDFYDGPKIDTAPITESWSKLTAKVPVFYAPGNHEMYGPYSDFVRSTAAAGVTVLDDKKTLYKGVQIGGMTYRGKEQTEDAIDALRAIAFDPNMPSILINHPPTFLPEVAGARVSLMVAGHTHNGQFWPNVYIVRAIYGIYTYGLHKYEHMFVLTTKGVGTAGPPMRLFNEPEVVIITVK